MKIEPSRPVSFHGRVTAFARAEAALLIAFLAVCALMSVFWMVADAVVEGEGAALDAGIITAFRDPADLSRAIGPFWLQEAARDVTALGSTVVLIFVLAVGVGYLWLTRRRGDAVLLLIAVVGGQMLSSGLKWLFARPRPDIVPHLVEVSTASFPSGHSTLSAVAYLTIGALIARVHTRKRVKLYVLGMAVVLTVAIGISRVYLGVHWPSDVLAGWALGAGWALACWSVAVRLRRTVTVDPPEISS